MDPLMGIAGAILVARWSLTLIRQSARVLLDRQAPNHVLEKIISTFDSQPGTQIADLHVWSIGPGIYAADIVLSADRPLSPDVCRSLLPNDLNLVHVTIEICPRNP